MNKQFVLIFGSTGRSGFHIANRLIAEGFVVRAFCRSRQKLTQLFGERQIGFQSIIEGNIRNSQDIQEAFKQSQHYGKITQVVMAAGAIPGQSEKQIEATEYISNIKIIEEAKKKNVKKFTLISAALITRPWNPITIILNTICTNVYSYKLKCENYLKRSGLNYAIVRPPQLVGEIKDEIQTKYRIEQGDTVSGRINRYTLAKLVVSAMNSQAISNKVTFECAEVKKEQDENTDFSSLRSDQEVYIKDNIPHVMAKRTYGLFFLAIIIGVGYWVINKYK